MALSSVDIAAFELAANDLVERLVDATTELDAELLAAFRELSDSDLPGDEVSRRVRRVLTALPREAQYFRAAVKAARSVGPEVRAAVVAAVPAEYQRAAYAAEDDEVTTDASIAETGEGETRPREPDVVVPADEGDDSRTVWLLGSKQEIEANAQLLQSRGFQHIRVERAEQLPNLRDESCCGVAIHGSWWLQFGDAQSVVEFLRQELQASNVPPYRVDTTGLSQEVATEVTTTLDGFDTSVRSRVQTSAGCVIDEVDLGRFAATASLLRAANSARLALEGITDRERRVLTVAIAMFEAEQRGQVANDIDDVIIRPLTAGQSSARVFRATFVGGNAVYVAKLDGVPLLQREMNRARSAAPADQALKMSLFSLNETAVLVQELVANLDQPLAGAPSLKERLSDRSAWEHGRPIAQPLLDDLDLALSRLVDSVRRMNEAPAVGDECLCWMGVEPLSNLASLDLTWTIESQSGEFDPVDVMPWIASELSILETTRTVHGDLHIGNVLLLDDRTPRLIDFAHAGPGHPCFDLVRLGSAVAYGFIRPVVSESVVRSFFEHVHLNRSTGEELVAAFPQLIAQTGARLAARALVLTRDAALELMSDRDDRETQYLAMVYLIAAQSLTIEGFQSVIARAALGAVYPRLTELRALAEA